MKSAASLDWPPSPPTGPRVAGPCLHEVLVHVRVCAAARHLRNVVVAEAGDDEREVAPLAFGELGPAALVSLEFRPSAWQGGRWRVRSTRFHCKYMPDQAAQVSRRTLQITGFFL